MTKPAIIPPGDMERQNTLDSKGKDSWEAMYSLNTPTAGAQPFPFIRGKIWEED